ncbi:MAG: glycyl-radical enzyme activating protein [Proteobacteria bacterium]|nr:glycyl-radical enzyme activating protein [Pseudomonadota bacterium]
MERIKSPLILDIKGNSLDDGPGIRSVIFFKGCPLSCVWCHNPESQKITAEVSFDKKSCVDCGACIDVCSENALSKSLPEYVDRKRCTRCFKCVDVCPSTALERVGREMTVEDIVNAVEKDKPFYETSGGGITLSGGEPTVFTAFLARLLEQLKKSGTHTLLETCGHFNIESFKSDLLPYLDMIYFDLKIMDTADHVKYCGISNRTILENFKTIYTLCPDRMLPRVPLIPDITDTVSNLKAIASYLAALDVKKISLLSYNPLWPEKCEKIGVTNLLPGNEKSLTWTSGEKMAKCREIFASEGILINGKHA